MSTMSPERRTRGFAMVTAIFVLVVLAMLGAFIATISSQNQVGAALDVQGARAYQAARAGIEWGLYQVLKAPVSACSSSAGGANIIPGVSGFTVTVQCTPILADEAGLVALYKVTAWACNTTAATCPGNVGNVSSLGYVERKLSVLAEK